MRAWPDPKYFDTARLPVAELERLLRSKAVLLPGLTVTLQSELGEASKTWRYPLGLQGYLEEAGAGVDAVAPIFTGEKYAGKPTTRPSPRARARPGRWPGSSRRCRASPTST